MPRSTPYKYDKYEIPHALRRLICARATCQETDRLIDSTTDRLNPDIFPIGGRISGKVAVIKKKLERIKELNLTALRLIEDLYEERG